MTRAARTFRIFVSSTFADLVAERNALQEQVFPRLRDFCMGHGARFQAIDLRWGVSEEAGLDQQTINICLDEIERCRRTSPRPNFIILLGDRYGWQPPPPQIRQDELEEILRRVSQDEKSLLQEWYLLDENAVVDHRSNGTPVHQYYLKARERDGRYADPDAWYPVEQQLRSILERAVKEMPLEAHDRLKYEASATEQEIHRGALRVPEQHVYCFFRTIEGLPQGEPARDYLNLDRSGHLDTAARGKLESLKEKLRGILPRNCREYTAKWVGSDPEDPSSSPITTDHIPQLCEDVYAALRGIIEQEIERLEEEELLQREIRVHDEFAEERARHFTGRDQILGRIASYVDNPDGRPLVIWGAGGSGKSAVMARAAQLAGQGYQEAVILRFIGITPESSSGRSLLASLCQEISRRYGADESFIPADYRELVRDFPERLALASPGQPLIVFLDALDQLSPAEGARSLSWLPSDLPAGVRIIVSTLPEDTLRSLQTRLPESSFLELTPMELGEGVELLDLWLSDAGRTLQEEQRREVLEKFEVERLPLWLKLAFEEARRWRSTDGHPEIELPPEIPDIIRERLFDRLDDDANHGKVMVSRSLGYLAAAKNGLSEDEMIEVLSLGGKEGLVLKDFFDRNPRSPKVDTLPVVVWSRLYFDLEPYLTERAADGASLMTFYHRQLLEAAKEEYMADEEALARHRELAGYFDYRGGPEEGQQEEMALTLRTMSELPYQETMGELWEDVFKTLTDFQFLERKAADMGYVETTDAQGNTERTYTGIYQIRDDYALALARIPGADGGWAGGGGDRRRIIVSGVDFGSGAGYVLRCPHCSSIHPFKDEWRGGNFACPTCRGPLKVNDFVVPPRPAAPPPPRLWVPERHR